MYEKVEVLQCPPLPNAYLKEPYVKQEHGPQEQCDAGRKSGQVKGRKLPMTPPTVQSMPAVPPSNTEGVYMSLSSKGRELGQESQYMPLSSATRETPGVNIMVRRTEGHWSRQQEERHKEPLYINQTRSLQHS